MNKVIIEFYEQIVSNHSAIPFVVLFLILYTAFHLIKGTSSLLSYYFPRKSDQIQQRIETLEKTQKYLSKNQSMIIETILSDEIFYQNTKIRYRKHEVDEFAPHFEKLYRNIGSKNISKIRPYIKNNNGTFYIQLDKAYHIENVALGAMFLPLFMFLVVMAFYFIYFDEPEYKLYTTYVLITIVAAFIGRRLNLIRTLRNAKTYFESQKNI